VELRKLKGRSTWNGRGVLSRWTHTESDCKARPIFETLRSGNSEGGTISTRKQYERRLGRGTL